MYGRTWRKILKEKRLSQQRFPNLTGLFLTWRIRERGGTLMPQRIQLPVILLKNFVVGETLGTQYTT